MGCRHPNLKLNFTEFEQTLELFSKWKELHINILVLKLSQEFLVILISQILIMNLILIHFKVNIEKTLITYLGEAQALSRNQKNGRVGTFKI